LILGATSARAQLAGATLSGQVSDPSNAIATSASLVVRNDATGGVRSLRTNGTGVYTATDLQPGVYSVTVSAPGFSTYVDRGLQLSVGETRKLDITLTVGEASERVEVSAVVADVETDTSLVSATVGQKRIEELPSQWQRLDSARNVAAGRDECSLSAIDHRGWFEPWCARFRQPISEQRPLPL